MKILLLGASKTGTTAITYAIHEALSDHEVIFEPASLEQINNQVPNFIAKYLNVRDLPGIRKYKDKFDRHILIVRHPLDRLISLLLYTPYNTIGFSNDSIAFKYIELLKQKTLQPDSHSVLEIIDYLNQLRGGNLINGFKRQYQEMIQLISSDDLDFFILKYEDFIDGRLQALGEYLNIKMNQADVEVPQQYQRVSRTKGYDDWKNWLTLSDLKQLQRDFAEICQTFQYDMTRSEDYSRVIDPKKSYQYTQSVVNEYRQKHFLPEAKEDYMMKDEGRLYDQAFADFKSGNFSEAESLIHQSIALNPKIPGFHVLLAKILIKDNQLEAASVAICKALELAPEIENQLPKKFLKIKNQVFN